MTDLTEKVTEVADRYRHGHDRPLGAYSVLDAVYDAQLEGRVGSKEEAMALGMELAARR